MSTQPRGAIAPRVANPATRQRMITAFMLLAFVVFGTRLVMIQGLQSADLARDALEARLTTATIEAQRADIVDRNGVVLATSVNRYHVFVNLEEFSTWRRIENKQVLAEGPLDAARILAPLLSMSESELAATLASDGGRVYLARDVTPETWDLIEAERIAGIGGEPTSERLYPNGAIAGNVVGFVGGRDDRQGTQWGLAGVELAFEEQLMGAPGSITYERGTGGTVIPTGVLEEQPAVPGSTVVLTIDRDLQYLVEQRLAEALAQTGSSRGIVVVSDVRTGEVLALVDSEAVNPNEPGASDPEDRGSRAVSSVFEPGSTGKTVTIAGALEEGLVTPESQFVAPYSYTTANDQTFRDSHEHPDQKLTTAGILVTSSNTGTIQIGQQLSDQQRYEYLRAFGFGEPTNVGLPGESGGILRHFEEWDGRTKYAVLYGQGVSATAIQTNQVYAAIANRGVLQPLTVVKGFEDAQGNFAPRETGPARRVVSEETAAEVMLMLESVTVEGTGRNAQIDGYRIAGKTGTAQADDGEGGLTSTVSSFVGIAPAGDPRIVVSVIMFDPQAEIWGSVVAAPVFKDVTRFALQSLRVPPSGARPTMYPTTWE